MTSELKAALAVSVGLHAGALIGLPLASRVEFDVERAPTSVEIFILAKPNPAVAPQPQPEPAKPETTPVPSPEHPEPQPQTVITPERRGALTELLPRYLRNPAPVYPHEAREQGWEGTTLLEAEVLTSGRCGTLRVLHSSGHTILDDAAERAIRAWRFKPALRGQTPVAVWVEIPVTFRLIESTQE